MWTFTILRGEDLSNPSLSFMYALESESGKRFLTLIVSIVKSKFVLNQYCQIREGGWKLKMAQEMLCQSKSSSIKGRHFKHKLNLEEKPIYTCVQCSKSFSQAYHLKTHMLTHLGEKKHKCTQCNYSTTYAHVLRDHRTPCVHNAINHSVELIIWRLICSLTPGKRSTNAHNATIQLPNLLL